MTLRPYPTCPTCGGQIRCTEVRHHWWSLVDTPAGPRWHSYGDDTVETRYYCEEDHPLPADLIESLPDRD